MGSHSDQLTSFEEATKRESEHIESASKASGAILEKWTSELIERQKNTLASISERMEAEVNAFEIRMRDRYQASFRAWIRLTVTWWAALMLVPAAVAILCSWQAHENWNEYREAKSQRESLSEVIWRDPQGKEWVRVDVDRYEPGGDEFFRGKETGNQYGKLVRGKGGFWYAPLGR